MKVLITGASGMIGTHFVEAFRSRGDDVVGLARPTSTGRQNPDRCYPFIEADVLDRGGVAAAIQEVRPDIIIHLAAQAFNGTSWRCEDYTYQANVIGTLNMLSAARDHTPGAKILVACSSAEYGRVAIEDCPLKEDRLLRPVSPYGVTKVATECMAFQHYSNYGMKIYLPRLFIHVGTGHPPATAIQNFAMQLALITKGRRPPVMEVGRLDTARDFIDVRDGVQGMLALLDHGQPGVPVNICTGEAVTIGRILEILMGHAGMKVEVNQSPKLLRPSDEPLLLGDNSRLLALGWRRRYTIEETLAAVFEDWAARVA